MSNTKTRILEITAAPAGWRIYRVDAETGLVWWQPVAVWALVEESDSNGKTDRFVRGLTSFDLTNSLEEQSEGVLVGPGQNPKSPAFVDYLSSGTKQQLQWPED